MERACIHVHVVSQELVVKGGGLDGQIFSPNQADYLTPEQLVNHTHSSSLSLQFEANRRSTQRNGPREAYRGG